MPLHRTFNSIDKKSRFSKKKNDIIDNKSSNNAGNKFPKQMTLEEIDRNIEKKNKDLKQQIEDIVEKTKLKTKLETLEKIDKTNKTTAKDLKKKIDKIITNSTSTKTLKKESDKTTPKWH